MLIDNQLPPSAFAAMPLALNDVRFHDAREKRLSSFER
jgi:hypothetical protein